MKSLQVAGGICLISSILMASTVKAQTEETSSVASKYWITQAPDDDTRNKRIEKYLRGFDQPMWEVGERFEKIDQAVQDSNYPLASYHWKKIKKTIENGLMKRPARRSSAEAILLNKTWGEVLAGFNSQQPAAAKTAFNNAKTACLACHIAERVPFINNQPLFTKSGMAK